MVCRKAGDERTSKTQHTQRESHNRVLEKPALSSDITSLMNCWTESMNKSIPNSANEFALRFRYSIQLTQSNEFLKFPGVVQLVKFSLQPTHVLLIELPACA